MNWKPIEGFDGYEISDSGLVKSVYRVIQSTAGWRNVKRDRTVNERILKPNKNGGGYLFVCLRKDNRHFSRTIHRLVAEHFLGGRQQKMVINHKNGIKTDNRVENLEYCSSSKNTQEYYKSIGKEGGKIPYSHIPGIIKRVNDGERAGEIAEEYNVRRNDICILGKILLV